MSTIKSFKDLLVWQRSFDLVSKVYEMTNSLPAEERFGLVSQLRRCSVSIPSNIAEGTKRGTTKDYIQFVRIAFGSSAELETQLLLVDKLYNIEVNDLLVSVDDIQKMLQSLITSLSTKT